MSETKDLPPPRAIYSSTVLVIWLDLELDGYDGAMRSQIDQVRIRLGSFKVFTNVDECIDFLTDVKTQTIFIVMPSSLSQQITPLIDNVPQLVRIYSFLRPAETLIPWTAKPKKVAEVSLAAKNMADILEQDIHEFEVDLIPMSILSTTGTRRFDELEPSFMYSQLLKTLILDIEHKENAVEEFISYFRKDKNCMVSEENLRIFKDTYTNHPPTYWYSKESFLFETLNRSLRNQDTQMLIKMAFFLKDLHRRIETLHAKGSKGSKTLYRGQVLPLSELEKIKKRIGGLLSFNSFLSTDTQSNVAFGFAEGSGKRAGMVQIIFTLNIDPSNSSIPYASIAADSRFSKSENEVLLSMHSVFRIDSVDELTPESWMVTLSSTTDDDPELRSLNHCIQQEIGHERGWQAMGQLLTKMGHYDRAIEIYQTELDEMPKNDGNECIERSINYYSNIGVAYDGKGEYSAALSYYKKAQALIAEHSDETHPLLITTYNNIAAVHRALGDHAKAMKYLTQVIEILERQSHRDDALLGVAYSNRASVHRAMGDYRAAVDNWEKARVIQEGCLPAKHPHIATLYNNIAETRLLLGDCSQANMHFETAFETWQRSLPADHPWLAISLNNIGELYRTRGEYRPACDKYERAIELLTKSQSPHHPMMATIYNNMALAQQAMGNMEEAMAFSLKAVDVMRKAWLQNPSTVVTIYNNIAGVFQDHGEHMRVIVHLKNALVILRERTPIDYLLIVATLNNIGEAYRTLDKPRDALAHLEEALEIWKSHLPENHPSIATTYNNIGLAYFSMWNYSDALMYLAKAHEIQKETLPSNHPDIAWTMNNMNIVRVTQGIGQLALQSSRAEFEAKRRAGVSENDPSLIPNYYQVALAYRLLGMNSEALNNLRQIFEIQLGLPSLDASDLARIHSSMAIVHLSLGDDQEALFYFQMAGDFWRDSLSSAGPGDQRPIMNQPEDRFYFMFHYCRTPSDQETFAKIRHLTLPLYEFSLCHVYNNMAIIFENSSEYSNAIEQAQLSLDLARRTFGRDHSECKRIEAYRRQLQRQLSSSHSTNSF